MERRLKQQGNQADKLLPEVYSALQEGGALPRLVYAISPDGSITNDEDYIKPNEPYSIILEKSVLDTRLDDISAFKVQTAGALIIKDDRVLLTYTRAADSTNDTIYFTNLKSDGTFATLTYTVSQKTLTT